MADLDRATHSCLALTADWLKSEEYQLMNISEHNLHENSAVF